MVPFFLAICTPFLYKFKMAAKHRYFGKIYGFHATIKITVAILFKHKTLNQCCVNVGLASGIIIRRKVLGFEGEENTPKLNFSGNLPKNRNKMLKLPVIPAGAFSIIQDGIQDGRQNVHTPKIL